MKWEYPKPKFKIGDIVMMQDEFRFNPANDVTSIGRVEAIHFYKGRSLCIRVGKGETEPRNYYGRIVYTISGFSLMPEESHLQLCEDY